MRCLLSSLTTLALLAAGASPASAQVDFSQTVTFGDSLTGNDLLFLAARTSPDLFGSDPAEALFEKGAGSDDALANFAVPGASIIYGYQEISAYWLAQSFGLVEEATFISYEMGSNDLIDKIDTLAAGPPGTLAGDFVTRGILTNLDSQLLLLRIAAPDAQIVVWTIPDITRAPRYYGKLTTAGQRNVRRHVAALNRGVRQTADAHGAAVYELAAVLDGAIAAPPVIAGTTLAAPPAYGDYADLFADTLHPTAVGNGVLANALIAAVNSHWNANIPSYSEAELAELAHITASASAK